MKKKLKNLDCVIGWEFQNHSRSYFYTFPEEQNVFDRNFFV